MYVISVPSGIVLVFEDAADLAEVTEHLVGLHEHIASSKVPPPHLYCTYDADTTSADIDALLSTFKEVLADAAIVKSYEEKS